MPSSDFDIVALDADNTLWHDGGNFLAARMRFRELLTAYHDSARIDEQLYNIDACNVGCFGYGVKGFILSMIETAIQLTGGQIKGAEIEQIIRWGREMLQQPIELLEGVKEAVRELSESHRLMLLTKGDIYDQERKLAGSALGEYFSAVEIVSEKDARSYRAVMSRYAIQPARFLMAGDSLRSDVLPVLEVGGAAVHIPYGMTGVHESVREEALKGKEFVRLETLRDLPMWLNGSLPKLSRASSPRQRDGARWVSSPR